MSFRVFFSPEAEDQLVALFQYISEAASPEVADSYTGAIVSHCEGLASFPYRGIARDDVRKGLRITHYRGRAIIAFSVDGDLVTVLGVFYGGQDYEVLLQAE